MTLLTISIVRKYVILIDKSINLKLISKKNYDTKLKKKKKKKVLSHMQSACDEASFITYWCTSNFMLMATK